MNSASSVLKKSVFCLLTSVLCGNAFAQTNVFPSSGNVGIGTTSPGSALDVIKPGNANVYENGLRVNRPDSQGQYAFIGYAQFSSDAYFGSVYTGAAGYYGRIFLRQYTQGMTARDAMMIDSSGNVGIGTVSPQGPLHVMGGYGAIRVDSNIGGNIYADVSFWNGAIRTAGIRSHNAADSNYPNILEIWSESGSVVFPGSKVGIGTATPTAQLEVLGGIKSSGPTAGMSRLVMQSTAAGGQQYEWYNDYAGAGSGVLGLFNRTAGNNPMAITASGNVGIGTTNPTHKLVVNGTIRAKEVIVDTGWADYVFAKDYRLAPLSEVEAHIKTAGRLPDVPSAQEVADKGVSVGEAQSILLRKIEELTLHQIEQEKQLATLQRENAALRARVCSLEENAPKL